MTPESKPSRGGNTATIVATASVTLAIGVTIASLSGYLTPPLSGKEAVPAPVAVAEVAPPQEVPQIVFVPVTQEPPLEQRGLQPAPVRQHEPVLAALESEDGDEYEPDDDDEHEHRRGGRDRGRDHDDDDD